MKVLITGAKGTLGSVIYKSFLKRDLQVVPYSHSMDLSLIDWDSIDFVINCAAVVPGINVSNDKYVDGNIVFLQKILPYCAGKKFIHFSSLSELYKSEIYQITKMIGNSVLQANVHLFSGLKIIPLATLDDSDLILSIVRKAENGLKPTVDQLKYNFISYEAVADYVFLLLFDFSINNLPSFYIEKNLYAEVAKVVGSQKIELGRVVDRILVKDGVFCATPELLSLLSC